MENELEFWRKRARQRDGRPLSERTLEAYALDLEMFFRWGGSAASTAEDLARYLESRPVGPSAKGNAVSALKSFFRVHGSLSAARLRVPPVRKRLQRTLSNDEALQVLCSLDTSTITGKRDVALFALLIDSGLRATEVCRLMLADIDLDRLLFSVIVKGGQEKFGTFSLYTGSLLAEWLSVRPQVARQSCGTVFVSLMTSARFRGGPLTRDGLRCWARRLARDTGVRHFSPHALRRSMATMAIEAGCPLPLLQDAGRWSDPGMVERYSQARRLSAFANYAPMTRLMGSR